MAINPDTVGTAPVAGYPGYLVDFNGDQDVITVVNGASAAVNFGVAVALDSVSIANGAQVNTGSLANNAADVVAGISTKGPCSGQNTTDVFYAQGDAMPVLKKGRIYAAPFENVTAQAAVYFRPSDGRLGSTSASNGAVPTAKWLTTTSADGLGVIEINLP